MYLSSLSLALNRPGAVSLEQVVASLFAAGEQGAWYDPSAANVTWRRNLLTYTEQFDNAAWTKELTTSQANQTTDPFGSSLADTLVDNTNFGRHIIYQTLSGDFGIDRTLSVYAKANTLRYLFLSLTNTGDSSCYSAIFDLQDGVATATKNNGTATVVAQMSAVGNGWYRCSISGVVASTGSGNFFPLIGSSDRAGFTGNLQQNNAPNYSGTSQSLYLYGAQLERGTTATAYQRIVTPEITYLADVQSQPLLFQDSTGATPVTAVEQPVGLILDKRKGLVLGPELVTNGDFSNSFTGWTAGTAWSVVSGRAYLNTTGAGSILAGTFSVTTGSTYKLTFDYEHGVGSNLVRIGNVTFNIPAANGTYTAYFTAANTNALQFSTNSATAQYYIDNVTVKLFDGNHAYQTGSTARPVLRARYNLLTYSEQFDNGVWTRVGMRAFGSGSTINATIAPDGTTTADLFTEDNANSDHYVAYTASGGTIGATYTFSAYVKPNGRTWVAMNAFDNARKAVFFNLVGAGAVGTKDAGVIDQSIVSLPNGWYRISSTRTLAGTTTFFPAILFVTADNTFPPYTGDNTSGVYLWGADLRVGTSAGDYQRIAAATDYATTSTITGQPFRPYLDADGSDDWLRLASCNLGNTWSHVGGWNCDVAGRRAFTTSDSYTSAMRANGSAGSLGFMAWYDTTNTMQNIATGTMLVTNTVATVERQSLTALSGRYNGGNSLSITPFDDRAQSKGLALFTESNASASSLWDGKFYGGLWIARSLTSGERAAAESYIAQKTGVTL